MALERKEVDPKDCWNVELLFTDVDAWEAAYKEVIKDQKDGVMWPHLQAFQGTLSEGAKALASLLKESITIERACVKVYTYAHLKHDEDIANETYKALYDRSTLLLHSLNQETAWIDPEILSLPEETFKEYLGAKELEPYRTLLERLYRLHPHTLNTQEEGIVAQANRALDVSHRAFSALANADIKFPDVADSDGKKHELTQGTYSLHMQSPDRTLREGAFKQLHQKIGAYENTLCELIGGQVQNHYFTSQVRKYENCLESALFPHEIDLSVYHNLIATVRKRLPDLHHYMKLRKRALGFDSLNLYDMHVPLVSGIDKQYTYEEAEHLVIESVAPLGKEYQDILRKGLTSDRWVDRYENARKRSGAYSSGCFDSSPYILMNFHGTHRDVMTLTHEAGHSMHTYHSNHNQPYHYSRYSIFLAEVASTLNEELLFRYLLERAESKEEKAYLINQKVDDIRSTLFRQTMFAEFELALHSYAEQGIPLTRNTLKEKYFDLNKAYFGPDVTVDDIASVEFMRVPHFFYNYYVYQYSTGISAALTLASQVMKNGPEAYLGFLRSGCSKPPLETLKLAGVDMCSDGPVNSAIDTFTGYVKELESLL